MSTSLARANEQDLIGTDEDFLTISIQLPTEDDVSEEKVAKYVRDVFPGYTKTAAIIKDKEALASFAAETMMTISKTLQTTAAEFLARRAAAAARYWDLCSTIERSISSGGVDDSAIPRIAAATHQTVQQVYGMINVAKSLTLTQAYLLGTRGVGTPTLSRLASVDSQSFREAIINAFINSCKDTSNRKELATARKQLEASIENGAVEELDFDVMSSDPTAQSNTPLVSEEYAEAKRALDALMSASKKLSNAKVMGKLIDALDNFYLMDSPNAAMMIDLLVVRAEELEQRLKQLRENLSQLDSSVASFKRATPVKASPKED